MNAPIDHAGLARHYAEVRRRLTANTAPRKPVVIPPTLPDKKVLEAADLGEPHVEHVIAWHRSTNAGLQYIASRTPTAILRDVCTKHSISLSDLIGPTRQASLMPARREAAYRLREETRLSYPAIARRMGRTDHTSARHHCLRYLELTARGLA